MSELDLLKFIEPKELIEFYEKIQNLFPICIKCQKPILFQNIKEDKKVKIKIECPFCNYSEKLTLNDYITKLESLIPEKKYCNIHTDKLSYGFCQDCNIWQCKKCFIDHISTNHIMYQSQFKIRPTCKNTQMKKQAFITQKVIHIYVINVILNLNYKN